MTYLKELVSNLLGTYQPIVQRLTDGTEVVQYDINYIVSAVIFVIVLYSFFRILGAIICNK